MTAPVHTIQRLTADRRVDRALEIDTLSELPSEVARRTGYRIVNHRLDFFGVCPQCQAIGGH
ncbi:MAG: hypothetical protein WBH57_12825 [Anaerolineae bacterium]